jgi:hypothetical protein
MIIKHAELNLEAIYANNQFKTLERWMHGNSSRGNIYEIPAARIE